MARTNGPAGQAGSGMSDIPPINRAGQLTESSPARHATRPLKLAETSAPDDEVSISEAGQILSRIGDQPSIRADRVMAAYQAIAEGDYVTPQKIEAVADKLLALLNSGSNGAFRPAGSV